MADLSVVCRSFLPRTGDTVVVRGGAASFKFSKIFGRNLLPLAARQDRSRFECGMEVEISGGMGGLAEVWLGDKYLCFRRSGEVRGNSRGV